MTTAKYFEEKRGVGIISTADAEGRVNSAIYSRPHFMEDGTVAFIMRDRLTRANLRTNPYASYMFIESRPGYRGKRLYLKMVGEEQETDRLYSLKRRTGVEDTGVKRDPKSLVFFELDREVPLVARPGENRPVGPEYRSPER